MNGYAHRATTKLVELLASGSGIAVVYRYGSGRQRTRDEVLYAALERRLS